MTIDLFPSRIKTAVLRNSHAQITLLNLGCITQSWRLNDWPDNRSAVLGYQHAQDYLHNPEYLGAIVGRVANRIENARFDLKGDTYYLNANDQPNTLHGGTNGLSSHLWNMEVDGDKSVQFQLHSKNGDQGFPGSVDFKVTITLNGHCVLYDMTATVSEPTPINLAQHNYYNLNGMGTVSNHALHIPARAYLQTDTNGIPTTFQNLTKSHFDFTTPKKLTKALLGATGLDTNYCLDPENPEPITLTTDQKDVLTMHTDQPGLQVYTANKLPPNAHSFGAQFHGQYGGICLEPQGYPNAMNRPDFPSILVTPETPYRQKLQVLIQSGSLT